AVGELDDAVGLGGHDVAAVGQADVDALPAPPQGEEQLVGVRGGAGPDGDGALELGHRAPEGVGQLGPGGEAAGDQGRDDLGVGGDLGREGQPVAGREVGEVVDVAVQDRGHVGPVGAVELVAVDRVGVGL